MASSLMSLGMRAMAANYAALQVTGHNIANANVPGYSRQRVELATALGQFSGAGYFGKGADVAAITRAHNAFLTRESFTTNSLASKDDARWQQLLRLETVFPPGDSGLGATTLEFLNAFSDLANLPADSAAREVVLARAQELATQFSNAGQTLDEMQELVRLELDTTAAKVNALTSNIALINGQIAAARGTGQTPNDLLDARDTMLAELSTYISFNTVEADDGSIGVFAAGGQPLVLSAKSLELQVVDDLGDPRRAALAVVNGSTLVRVDPSSIAGGTIAGLLQFQNEDLVDAQTKLGQLAAAIASAVNEQQAKGFTLHEPPGSVSPLDFFTLGAPVAQPNGNNATDTNGNYIGSVSLTVTDASQLQASEYELAEDPDNPGQWQLTRLSDGLVRSVADGDEVDGFRIDIGTPAPVAGDSFLLQPVTYAATTMAMALTDPRDIAAASPLTATVGPANTGTAAIGALTIVGDNVDTSLTASISFVDDAGNYTWELRDATTNALVSSGSGTWQAGEPIPPAGDPDINGFSLMLSGVPRGGDTVSVAMTTDTATNNGNVLALASLREAALVGRVDTGGGTLVGGSSFTDAYASAMADVGVRVQSAGTVAQISAANAAHVESSRMSEVGVNLDEEAAALIQYQQTYQAAAKVLQVAQQVFDTLLQTTA